jgi:hypothetical protein
MITKLVESNHYHVWTDAIHARQLAKQTNNKWDRGTYVRWTLLTCWIALEMACQDALSDKNISYKFRENLDKAVADNQLPPLDWSRGTWQKVTKVQNMRKDIAHRFASEKDLFPETNIADESIQVIREAIKTIYKHCGKPAPEWVEDDYDEGWTTGTWQVYATGTSSPYVKNKDAIKVSYIYKGHEYIWDYLAPETDINQPLENIFKGVGKPITAVRLSRGDQILVEYLYDAARIRGA